MLRTLRDLFRRLSLTEAVVIADMALHAAMVKREALRSLGSIIDYVEPAAESAMESRLRMLLVLGRLPRPEAQVEIRDGRQTVVELNQIAKPVDRFELVVLHQLIGHRHAIDAFAAIIQLRHPREDAAMFFEAEIVGLKGAGDGDERYVVHQNGAEHKTFGIQVRGKSSLERNVLHVRVAVLR